MTTTTPNSLDYQKLGLNLHKNQIDLTKHRVELMGKEPGAYDAELGLLNDFQESNQTRKSGWRALLDGMTSGLKYSLNSAENKKKREVYANMEKMFSSFEEAGKKLQSQNEQHMRKAEDMETKVIPSAVGYLSYLQNNPSYDEAFNNLNGRVEQIRSVMPFDGELVALNPRNYEVGIFKDRKTGQLKETPISSLLPPDLLKGRPDLNPYERAKDAQKMAIDRQNAASHQKRAEASMRQAKTRGTNSPEEEETQTYLELYNLLKDPNKDPTSGVTTSVKNWVAQNVPVIGKLAEGGLAENQAYLQSTANLKGQAFKKHGYRNQAEFENIRTLDAGLPREEALKFVTRELQKRGVNVPADAPMDAPAPPQASGSQTGGTASPIKVQDPATGQIGLLSPDEAKIAISRGGIPVR